MAVIRTNFITDDDDTFYVDADGALQHASYEGGSSTRIVPSGDLAKFAEWLGKAVKERTDD